MTEITSALVKELREKTGAGMMECKKALVSVDGNLEEAIDYLRKKGLSVAAKKSGRVAAQGLVGVKAKGKKGSIVELNSETDFVARNDEFQDFVKTVLDVVEEKEGVLENVQKAMINGKTLEESLVALIAKIGENMNLRRVQHMEVENGVVASYVHTAVANDLGRIGVLVALESTGKEDALLELGKKIAMHIAASSPKFLDISDVDNASLERERSVLIEQAKGSGKPEAIIEKMVEGRIKKYYEEVVLLEQPFIMDSDKKVRKIIQEAEEKAGAPIQLKAFVSYTLGEGLEKKEENFAEEVNKQLGK